MLFAAGAAVERWQPASGARSATASRWPSRRQLCVDCREINGRDVVVASGEVVPEAAAATSGGAAAREHTKGDPGECADGDGLFAIGGHETAGRAKRMRRRQSAAVACVASHGSRGGGDTAQHSVPSAEGRSPLEVWEGGGGA